MSSHAHTHEQLARMEGPKSGPMSMKTRQQKYGQAIRGRFIRIRAEMRRGIAERDVFGLRESGEGQIGAEQLASDFDPDDLTPSGYSMTDDARKHERFMSWLRTQQRRGVLSLISRNGNLYIRAAASDGIRWANARLREAGVTVGEATVESVFNAPTSANTLRLLFQRNYELLEGITSDVASEVSRVLTRGFAEGDGPREIARDIADRIDSVGLTRASLLARYETMNAANTASKARFKQMDVGQVDVLGHNPCDECEPIVEGGPYPIDDIPQGGPPFHPNCVGCISPVV